ncbi:MAG: histidinol-phosphate transaminase [Planctomycetaceae bacterium]|uniref:Histidinol-phosphate aminotransferase n=1 Tax=Lacipirellula limnantheis TaxID=2528024 RepID=A0A517U116_9BACT|nr:histidinol-phosphate transaminase [Lacipirellula limnantheis]MBL9162628.1 histidinol-phosphate transaminase [Planctomycetaceae bacterium]QDT74311.1 Histidinol-phosphate aminotransferase [Lacipirellula limnantheis]
MFRTNITAMQGYVPGEQPQGMEYVKLNTNENPYPCSPTVKAAIGRVLQVGLQRYPDPLATAFRERAAALLKDEVPGITPDWIMCGNGSDDILTIVTRSFVAPGGLIRFPRPSYVLYNTLAAIQGADSETVEFESDWTLDERFTATDERLQLAFLPNPNSPTGTVIAPSGVAHLAAALPCPLIVDEAYADFAETNCLGLVATNERILVTRTLSKSYSLAGLRFGFVVAQPQVIEQLNKVKDSYNCDSLSIAGATAAIDDQAHFVRTRDAILATRQRMTSALRGLGFDCIDSQANFVWCRHGQRDSRELYQQLKDAGVLVRYMNYAGWGEGLRISVGSDEQCDLLLAKLAAIV